MPARCNAIYMALTQSFWLDNSGRIHRSCGPLSLSAAPAAHPKRPREGYRAPWAAAHASQTHRWKTDSETKEKGSLAFRMQEAREAVFAAEMSAQTPMGKLIAQKARKEAAEAMGSAMLPYEAEELLRRAVKNGEMAHPGPSATPFASCSVWRSLLMPQVHPGSVYRCGRST